MAQAIFEVAANQGRKPVQVRRITTQDYPTPAKRPANSRLDNTKIQNVYGIKLPQWRSSLGACVERLLREENKGILS